MITVLIDRTPSEPEDAAIQRVADDAIGLWRTAEALGDPDLLDCLRPVLMQVGRILARSMIDAEADETRN